VAWLPEIAGVASLHSSEACPLMSLLWQKAFLSNESCHSSPAHRVHLAVVRSPEIAWISHKALWREAWCSGVVCHLSKKPYFFANVGSHQSRLLLASEPAPQAKCQKCRRHGIGWTAWFGLFFSALCKNIAKNGCEYRQKRLRNNSLKDGLAAGGCDFGQLLVLLDQLCRIVGGIQLWHGRVVPAEKTNQGNCHNSNNQTYPSSKLNTCPLYKCGVNADMSYRLQDSICLNDFFSRHVTE